MSSKINEPAGQKSLRLRALSHLTGKSDPQDPRVNASAALAVLHDLASSPATAADSLKLLHELQVHQVELDLQEEELRRAVADLETALFRQAQLYDLAPVGLFEVDRSMVLCRLNRMGARLLGFERDALIGRTFDSFMEPGSAGFLRAALGRVAENATTEGCQLHLTVPDGGSRSVYASVGPDPAGSGFLVACVDFANPRAVHQPEPRQR